MKTLMTYLCVLCLLLAGCRKKSPQPASADAPTGETQKETSPDNKPAVVWNSSNPEPYPDRECRVIAEINSLDDDHPWAGRYYEGDGLGTRISLVLAEKTGFVYTWRGCLGLYDYNYGSVESKEGKLRFVCQLRRTDSMRYIDVGASFIPVKWGRRRYLIPEGKMVEFCNAVNGGSEPRHSQRGSFLLRRGDEEEKVTGLPDLPQEYSKWLFVEPLQAAITDVSSPLPGNPYDPNETHTAITLNVGIEDGVYKGLIFFPEDPNAGFIKVEVLSVGTGHSFADYIRRYERDATPTKGMKLSTRDTIYDRLRRYREQRGLQR